MFKTIPAAWRNHKNWVFFFLLTDIMFAVFLWLVYPDSFYPVLAAFTLGCILLLAVALFCTGRNDDKKYKAFMAFLEEPSQEHESEALRLSSPFERDMIQTASCRLSRRKVMRERGVFISCAQVSAYSSYSFRRREMSSSFCLF